MRVSDVTCPKLPLNPEAPSDELGPRNWTWLNALKKLAWNCTDLLSVNLKSFRMEMSKLLGFGKP
jgi:hypothetical protein